MILEWYQFMYMALLLLGSVAAYLHGSKFLILIMWLNFTAMLTFGFSFEYLMLADVLSAYVILMVIETKEAKTVAFIYCVMAIMHPFSEVFGYAVTYWIMDALALGQILALGNTGYGKALDYGRGRYRLIFDTPVPAESLKLDPAKNDRMVVVKGKRP